VIYQFENSSQIVINDKLISARTKSDGESTSEITDAYTTEEIETGVGFDEWAMVEKKKDHQRRMPLRINSKKFFIHAMFQSGM
jgi:hypothetical protein